MDEQILNILKEIQSDVKGLKSEMKSMQGEIKSMQGEIKSMQGEIKSMKDDIRDIKETQKEHSQILRALEHNSQIAKSERESMKMDINTIIGKVSSIENTVNCVESVTAHNWSEIIKIKSKIA